MSKKKNLPSVDTYWAVIKKFIVTSWNDEFVEKDTVVKVKDNKNGKTILEVKTGEHEGSTFYIDRREFHKLFKPI